MGEGSRPRRALGGWSSVGLIMLLLLVSGSFAIGAGGSNSEREGESTDPAIWCPCTNSYVNRVSDCPDCGIDGLDIYASPPEVIIRGQNVQGRLDLANGRDSKEYRFRFTWTTGDTLRTTGGYRVEVVIADGNSARWTRSPLAQGRAQQQLPPQAQSNAFRGRFRGARPGNTTARFQLVEDGTNTVAYTTPPVQVVIRP